MKPGVKTTEFLGAVAVAVGSCVASFEGDLSPRWAALASAVVAGLYAVGRGLAKQGTPGA